MPDEEVAVPRAALVRLVAFAQRGELRSFAAVDRQALEVLATATQGPALVPPPGRAPYGWEWSDGALEPLGDEQAVIAEIRRLRGPGGGGASLRQVAERLNKAGVRAPSGGLWRSESVRRVLRRVG